MMPKPRLKEPYRTLSADVIDTLITGLKEWRPDLSYPESHSDMEGCVRALLRMYEVNRRPVALDSLPIHCETCGDTRHVIAMENGKPNARHWLSCPDCEPTPTRSRP